MNPSLVNAVVALLEFLRQFFNRSHLKSRARLPSIFLPRYFLARSLVRFPTALFYAKLGTKSDEEEGFAITIPKYMKYPVYV